MKAKDIRRHGELVPIGALGLIHVSPTYEYRHRR